MKILITGGAGFIGLHTARALASDHDLVAIDNLLPQVHLDPETSRANFPGTVLVADVCDEEAWKRIGSCDLVIHLAAETGVGQSMYEKDRYFRVNVSGTSVAARFAAEWDAPLVSVSSRAVYGEGRCECEAHGTRFGGRCCGAANPAPSSENDELRPVSFYGETKSLAEREVAVLAAQVPTTVIRPQNVVGPGQALHNPYTGVLAAFLARLREGKPLSVYGDGTATRDFMHVDDLARILAWAITHPPDTGKVRILNAGTGVRTTLNELAATAIAGSPRTDTTIEHVPVHRPGDIEHACADVSRLQEVRAPAPRWTSRDAIVDFIRKSWGKKGAESSVWNDALDELSGRGLA
ncbi:dTDP-L-rhamnose 4-epimerase [Marmoricola sp. URHA0025 HA25]